MVLLPRRGALVAAVALAVVVLTGCGAGSSNRRSRRQSPAPIVVTVQTGKPGRDIPYGFLGLSLEFRSVEAYAGVPEVSTVSSVDGRYAVSLPAGSAALLTLLPPASP